MALTRRPVSDPGEIEPSLIERWRAQKAWAHRNPEARRAHVLVQRAIRRGALKKRPCERCGSLKAEAHHDDYGAALVVTWLCRFHHRQRHRELRCEATGSAGGP